MAFASVVGGTRHVFADLPRLLACATPFRSGDALAGLAAESATQRVAAQRALADLPLRHFLHDAVIPYEADDVTRLILDSHDATAFAAVSHLTVGGFRDWLLADATSENLAALAPGLTPEMVAAASKICRLQDLIAIAAKCRVTTCFRNTLGLPGTLSIRLQPNDPVDDPRSIAAQLLDGLLLGAGDAVIGVNPATDNVETLCRVLGLLDAVRERYAIPTQTCVLAHVTTTLLAIQRGAPVDLVFQSIGGTEALNRSFGVSLALLAEAHEAALSLQRGTVGDNVMYFETGQGSALSAEAHQGVDQQTLECRAYAVARKFRPLLVNSVVGFIGPEYLHDGKQILRAGLEDHFCGKLLGLPMGVDVCYTNHAEADQDDMDALLTLLTVAGVTYVMGVPGADDTMLAYQSTSFHDGRFARAALGKTPAPEFAEWLHRMGWTDPTPDRREGHLPLPLAGEGRGGGSQAGTPHPSPAIGRGSVRMRPAATLPTLRRDLRRFTTARVGLGRVGNGVPTAAHLDFQEAHAQARDAVWSALDVAALRETCPDAEVVASAAPDRQTYLLRPDLGRRLAEGTALPALPGCFAIVIADGLCASGVQAQAPPTLAALLPGLHAAGRSIVPVVIATQARVALGDAIGAALGAAMVAVLIGERPGLSALDSMGIYLTAAPRPGRTDAERNCISNIRPAGLSPAAAARKLLWLVAAAGRLGATGVALKDEQPDPPKTIEG